MRVLLVGAGGVGAAAVGIAARRDFYQQVVVADRDLDRARQAVAAVGTRPRQHGHRFSAVRADTSSADEIRDLCRAYRISHVLNTVDPRYTLPVFQGALAAGADYLDLAMSLSRPHPTDPHRQCGVKLGDEQFAASGDWERAGRLALIGIGVDPGLSDVFARYAADHLFSVIDEVGVRGGANLTVSGASNGTSTLTPTFSTWNTLRECLNPPVVWQRDRGWFTTAPFSEPEVFDFPAGIGPVHCVNVEHEEVMLIPRWINARRVTFKYGLGVESIEMLRTLHRLGLDGTRPVQVGKVRVAPRDVLAACLPDPARLAGRLQGRTCTGTHVHGTGPDGRARTVYLYHVVDNEWSMREYGHQATVWQTALNPVIALELLAAGTWKGTGVLGPEAFDAAPFLAKLVEYGAPWGIREGQ